MDATGLFLWGRILLIIGLSAYLIFRVWRQGPRAAFRIGRFTREGSRQVRDTRHNAERAALAGLDEVHRSRLEESEKVARRRFAQGLSRRQKSPAQKPSANKEDLVVAAASAELKRLGLQKEREEKLEDLDTEVFENESEPETMEEDDTEEDSASGEWGAHPSKLSDEPPQEASGASPVKSRRRRWTTAPSTPELTEAGSEESKQARAPTPKPTPMLRLRLRNLDKDRLEVIANGKPLAQFEGEEEQEVMVPAGRLILEVLQLGGDGYCRARLDTLDAKRISLNITDSQLMNCTAKGGLWPLDIESRKNTIRSADALSPPRPPTCDQPPPGQGRDDEASRWDALAEDPTRVEIRVRSLDGEWADIHVGGKVLMRIRSQEETRAFIPRGTHIIEVHEYLAQQPYCRAELITGDTPEVLLDIEQNQPLRSFNQGGFRLIEI